MALDVKGSMAEDVKGSMSEDVKGNISEAVQGNISEAVQGNISEAVQGNMSEDFKGNIAEAVQGNVAESGKGNMAEMYFCEEEELVQNVTRMVQKVKELVFETKVQEVVDLLKSCEKIEMNDLPNLAKKLLRHEDNKSVIIKRFAKSDDTEYKKKLDVQKVTQHEHVWKSYASLDDVGYLNISIPATEKQRRIEAKNDNDKAYFSETKEKEYVALSIKNLMKEIKNDMNVEESKHYTHRSVKKKHQVFHEIDKFAKKTCKKYTMLHLLLQSHGKPSEKDKDDCRILTHDKDCIFTTNEVYNYLNEISEKYNGIPFLFTLAYCSSHLCEQTNVSDTVTLNPLTSPKKPYFIIIVECGWVWDKLRLKNRKKSQIKKINSIDKAYFDDASVEIIRKMIAKKLNIDANNDKEGKQDQPPAPALEQGAVGGIEGNSESD